MKDLIHNAPSVSRYVDLPILLVHGTAGLRRSVKIFGGTADFFNYKFVRGELLR